MEEFAATLLARLGRVGRVISFAAFLILIGVVFADVASRELTGTGLHWARQAGVYANIFVVMFGLGVASAQGAHLRPRFADHWLPARWEPALDRIRDGLMALFCLAFAIVAIGVVMQSYSLGERSAVLRLVIWPVQAIIPVVFLVAAFRHGVFAAFPRLGPTGLPRGAGGIRGQRI